MSPEAWRTEFAQFKSEIEARFRAFTDATKDQQDKHHAENRTRLQSIDRQSVENGVKLDKLYGSEGQPGAVDRLSDKVGQLGDRIAYAAGGIAATVVLVGWWVVSHSPR